MHFDSSSSTMNSSSSKGKLRLPFLSSTDRKLLDILDVLATGDFTPVHELASSRRVPLTIDRVLHHGSQSLVFKVQDGDGRDLALKVMNDYHPQFASKRFQREITMQTTASECAKVPKIVEAGKHSDTGLNYITMEYVDGNPLSDVLKKNRDEMDFMPIGKVLDMGQKLAMNLALLHECDMIHGDFKPANVLATDDVYYLIDFNLSRKKDQTLIRKQDTVMGSPAFMAPEVTVGCEPDEFTDQYSFGLTMYLALTNILPTATRNNNLPAIDRYRVEDPRRIREDCSSDLASLILGCIMYSPQDRHDSMFWLTTKLATLQY